MKGDIDHVFALAEIQNFGTYQRNDLDECQSSFTNAPVELNVTVLAPSREPNFDLQAQSSFASAFLRKLSFST